MRREGHAFIIEVILGLILLVLLFGAGRVLEGLQGAAGCAVILGGIVIVIVVIFALAA